MFTVRVTTARGAWGVVGDDEGVHQITMPPATPRASRGTPPLPVAVAAEQLREYFAGTRRRFTVTRASVAATDFQRDVWAALEEIPYGQVATYGDVARAIGRPRATRAVGNANHANPWPILVPCHRVVAQHGLGGYGGGVELKEWLLARERPRR